MEKNSATALLLLTFAVTLVWCQPNAGTCNTTALTQYVLDNLDSNCAGSLATALYANVSVSIRDAALNTICTENCAGKLADWLLNNCSSKFNSTSLYYLCLQTGSSATVGRYCQYSNPPWFDADREILTLSNLRNCGAAAAAAMHRSMCNAASELCQPARLLLSVALQQYRVCSRSC